VAVLSRSEGRGGSAGAPTFVKVGIPAFACRSGFFANSLSLIFAQRGGDR
jgi:hypothetical protein